MSQEEKKPVVQRESARLEVNTGLSLRAIDSDHPQEA